MNTYTKRVFDYVLGNFNSLGIEMVHSEVLTPTHGLSAEEILLIVGYFPGRAAYVELHLEVSEETGVDAICTIRAEHEEEPWESFFNGIVIDEQSESVTFEEIGKNMYSLRKYSSGYTVSEKNIIPLPLVHALAGTFSFMKRFQRLALPHTVRDRFSDVVYCSFGNVLSQEYQAITEKLGRKVVATMHAVNAPVLAKFPKGFFAEGQQ